MGFNAFCSGQTFLPDGRLFVAGGNEASDPGENLEGIKNSAIFNPWTLEWSSNPDMYIARWYPTTTALSSGSEVLVSSGRITEGDADYPATYADIPEVFNWKKNVWRKLTGAKKALPLYPMMYQDTDGRVLYTQPASTSAYLSIQNNGSWVSYKTTKNWRNIGTSAWFDTKKIIVIGGTNKGTVYRSAEVLNMNVGRGSSPSWQYTGNMACPRAHANATILPDGKVLVTGGIKVDSYDPVPSSDVCYSAELWDPTKGTFTTMASMAEPRWYHSTALLLPDGRVFSAGGNERPTAEIYSPPYLFKGTRPVITTYPTVVKYGKTFVLGVGAKPARVTILALGAVTHGFNQNQRFRSLLFSGSGTRITVTPPSTQKDTPPGYYMIFILNNDGVPSEGKIIQLM
jgi:hypothetical protein